MRAFCCLVMLICLGACFGQVTAQSSGIAALLDLINQARIAQGTPPLAPSTVLTSVAQAHSNAMAQTGNLSHVGDDGSEFWQRMQKGGYTLTTGAENILVRADTDAAEAYAQWEASPAHLANMLNPAYHEIGIAYAQSTDGSYYYTMLLGARADSTPLPFPSPPSGSPANGTAVPTRALATTIAPSPTSIQLTPMTQPTRILSSSPTPAAPATSIVSQSNPQILLSYDLDGLTLINIASTPLDVSKLTFFSDGGKFSASRWEQYGATALEALRPGDCLQIWTLETTDLPEPATCQTRQAWLAIGEHGQFWRDASAFTVANDGKTVAQCNIGRESCRFALSDAVMAQPTTVRPTQAPEFSGRVGTDLELIVEPGGVTVINVSGHDLDFSGLTFVGDEGTFAAEDWDIDQLSRSLSRFPTDDCLQAWVFGLDEVPLKPIECDYRHAWVLIPQSEQFWLQTTSFSVLNQGVSVGTCATDERVCHITLP